MPLESDIYIITYLDEHGKQQAHRFREAGTGARNAAERSQVISDVVKNGFALAQDTESVFYPPHRVLSVRYRR